ncbi:hypothetical protein PF005_g25231 [Phytophthora fragariae]|uniref:Uncharacterized protein n=1 Tax=Phytophthora fragariae TaxID=53985 RepID=A0A6A3QE95_9STRA|nr:hypothetical protein PF003_g11435 [Phytophthora fragariae]KAE8924824.1 hypothetical protein PF009_g24952 [Phytophthora fragariae]KAE8991167.1 hypothetical protein PF011_g18052 [Phytophthora fragariae]KAE9074788.1 hypothetical protein PF007_g25267 [Phytophthora fragariae]KAE9088441.1 hypothetical protein PF010_g19378 [Phytophthora fragariae]
MSSWSFALLRKGSRCAPARKILSHLVSAVLGAGPPSANTAGPCFAGTPRGFAAATRPRNRSPPMVVYVTFTPSSSSWVQQSLSKCIGRFAGDFTNRPRYPNSFCINYWYSTELP